MIQMLRQMLRDSKAKNPDARFGKMLRYVLSEHRFQSLSTAQFQKAVERFMTPSMDLKAAVRWTGFSTRGPRKGNS